MFVYVLMSCFVYVLMFLCSYVQRPYVYMVLCSYVLTTFSGKLTFQNSRNDIRNLPFCPGSLQDTFIIYSSISHQQIFQKHFAKIKISRIGNLEISKVDPGKLVDSFSPRDGPVHSVEETLRGALTVGMGVLPHIPPFLFIGNPDF